jgi:uncharacterized protein (TIGR00369 family)
MESKAPFERFLAMDIMEPREGFARLMMPYKKEFTNPNGIIHGGAISSLADAAMAQAVLSEYGDQRFYTIKFEIEFKNSARSNVVAQASIVAKKLSFYMAQAEVKDNEDRLIAKASAKYFIPNNSN